MLRGWPGLAVVVAIGIAIFAGAVLYAVHRPPPPRGYSGIELAPMSPAAQARTPLLPSGGALIGAVAAHSPAAEAGIRTGEVVSKIDGRPVASVVQAARLMRRVPAGSTMVLTLYDVPRGEVRPRNVTVTLAREPEMIRTLTVNPLRLIMKEPRRPPIAAANAAWSRRILRGPTIKPIPLLGLGAGGCNGFTPQGWHVAGHSPDNSMFRVAADHGFSHAIYRSARLNGAAPKDFIRDYLTTTFASPAMLAPPQKRPYGFVLYDFGNRKGGAGFVLARVTDGRIAMWIAAVAGAEVSWARPQAGAVALSISCRSPGAPAPKPRDGLLATRISLSCIRGKCSETDFAATYLTVLRKGFVHNVKGEMFLVSPRRDFWQNGAEGPGFYRQTGGENEKLEPGRTN
ncbi:MAG TPA: PDZ domain-containing protein [Rhizomicrobium sp.]|jgi:hypothetical protein|nr:PDZ domain-containing protein [Rhizomicrobium sp.]